MTLSSPVSVCVFCGSHTGRDPRYKQQAQALGQEIARRGWRLVFGGGKTGLMGEVARSVLQAGGQVVGIIPKILESIEPPQAGLTELHVVENMRVRKALMSKMSDLFVVLPGGIGTMEEAFEALTNNWIGAFDKPLGFLDVGGYYDSLFAFLDHARQEDFIPAASYRLCRRSENCADLLNQLAQARGAAQELTRERLCDSALRLAREGESDAGRARTNDQTQCRFQN